MQNLFSTINYLMIETNSDCNLHCSHCTRDYLVSRGSRTPKKITENDLRFLLNQLKDCPINTIKLEGLSEPFLHPNFANLCAIIKKYFETAHLIVITNFQYSLEQVFFKEALSYINSLYISIDGTNEIYEHLRGGAKWDKFEKNLVLLTRKMDTQELKKIFLNFTATKENYREIPEIYKISSQYHLAGVRINLVQNWKTDNICTEEYPNEMIEYLKQFHRDIKGVPGWDYKNCFWPFNGLIIDVEGNIRQCILSTTQLPLANAFKMSLKEIFNTNNSLIKIRESLLSNYALDDCLGCGYKALSPHLLEIFEQTNPKPVARNRVNPD